MNKDFIIEKVKELINAGSCCKEAKEAGQQYLDAVGTAEEASATAALIAELKEDIVTIDGLIEFLQTPHAAEIFGAEGAKSALADAKGAKENGAKYCTCPACAACEAILSAFGEI